LYLAPRPPYPARYFLPKGAGAPSPLAHRCPPHGSDFPPSSGAPAYPPMNITELETKTLTELRDLARELDLSGYSGLRKHDLIFRLLQAETERQGNIFGGGVLAIVEDGFGFLRGESLAPSHQDVYVSQTQIRRFGLRTGDMISGQVRPPKENEKYFSLL